MSDLLDRLEALEREAAYVGPWRVMPAWAWLLEEYALAWGLARFFARGA